MAAQRLPAFSVTWFQAEAAGPIPDWLLLLGAMGLHVFGEGDELIVRKRQGALRLIHPLDHNYYETCRSKLGWGNRLVRADD